MWIAVHYGEKHLHMSRIDTLDALRTRLRVFVAERDWDQFHNPKNLAMALVAEAGELVGISSG